MASANQFRYSPDRVNRRSTSRGVSLLYFLVLIALVSGAVAVHFIHPRSASLDRQDAISKSLGAAQDALIGYATVAARPGELPCPDRTNDGLADSPCETSADRIGRIPWITLGIEDLWRNRGSSGPTDNSGETIWYAVSNAFRPGSATPMNADSAGDLVVNNVSGPPMTNVVAVLIAPGPTLPGQSREFAAQNSAANYLEGENATADTTFATGPVSGTFNDIVRPITHDALMRAVTARVARVASAALQAYFKAESPFYFPRARAYGEVDCDSSLTQGQLPIPANTGSCTSYRDWPTGSFPAWFTDNQWDKFIHYAVTSECSDPTATPCTATSGNIVVAELSTPFPAIVIVTGRALGSQTRPCTSVTDCLEAGENTDGDSTFVKSSANTNDRLEIVPIP